MKRSWLIGIIVLAVLIHIGVFLAFANVKPLPKKRHVPPPNFSAAEASYVDPTSGERMVVREYKVSTKLATPPEPPTTHDPTTAR